MWVSIIFENQFKIYYDSEIVKNWIILIFFKINLGINKPCQRLIDCILIKISLNRLSPNLVNLLNQ